MQWWIQFFRMYLCYERVFERRLVINPRMAFLLGNIFRNRCIVVKSFVIGYIQLTITVNQRIIFVCFPWNWLVDFNCVPLALNFVCIVCQIRKPTSEMKRNIHYRYIILTTYYYIDYLDIHNILKINYPLILLVSFSNFNAAILSIYM